MAKKLTAKDPTPKRALTAQEFGDYYREYTNLRADQKEAGAALRSFGKRAKSVGLIMSEMAAVYAEQHIDLDTLKGQIATREQYRIWCGLPVGTQGELDIPDGGAALAHETGPQAADPPEDPIEVPAAAAARKGRSRARGHDGVTAH